MDRSDFVDGLNRLLGINRDAEAEFETAATKVSNSEIETLFRRYAREHGKFAEQIREELERLGGTADTSGTLGGTLQRGWMDLKGAISGGSAATLLAACRGVEETAAAAYAEVSDLNPTGKTGALIQKQQNQIREFHTRLTRLVGETKDGVEFQKNE